MRITNNIFQKNALAALQVGARGVASAQKRVSTGLRIERPSDDPAASATVMGSQSSLRAIGQYQRNISSARSLAQAEEGALDRLTSLLTRAQELAVASGNAASGTPGASTVNEVNQLFEQAVQLANTTLAGRYVFGGANADREPLAADGSVNAWVEPAATDLPEVQISSGLRMRASHSAKEVFEDSGVMQALGELRTALSTSSDIGPALGALRDASERVQNLLGEVGAWSNQFDVTAANLDALEVNLKTFKSELQEVDLEEAVTELINRQSSYQAAMLATSRVMGMTLTDYLR